jgi:hypothetical protein
MENIWVKLGVEKREGLLEKKKDFVGRRRRINGKINKRLADALNWGHFFEKRGAVEEKGTIH